jgi:NADH-quinone oxidoreductase subunit L
MTVFLPPAFPLACALIAAALSKYMPRAARFLAFAGTTLALAGVVTLYNFADFLNYMPDVFGLTLAAFTAFFAALASLTALKEEECPWFYFNLLVSTAFAISALLADNFLIMLFFWEGLLVTLYLFLLPYNKETANKAFLINAAGDIALLAGVALFYAATRTLSFADAYLTNLTCVSAAAFILMFTGAVAKAGAFPFHSWIAPAAQDASFSFLALLPAAAEKLLAVFLLGKMFTGFFPILPAGARVFVCLTGAVTILIAALRLLTFKNLRQLLACSIVMQIGLLVLGLGVKIITPADTLTILNHGIFKAALLACAFLVAGYLNNAYGPTLNDIKGAAKKEPLITFILFVCALGLAGVSLVDIFFIPNAVLADSYEAMPLLAAVPVLAALVTVYAFAKVIYAMLLKTEKSPKSTPLFKAAALAAFAPVAFFTLGFEFSSEHLLAPHFAGVHLNEISALCAALLFIGLVLSDKVKQPAYEIKTDTYDYAKKVLSALGSGLFYTDRVMDKVLDIWPSAITKALAQYLSGKHRGNTPQYIIWAVAGIIAFLLLAFKGDIK